MGYHGQWNSTDQVPQRAVASGLIDRFGAIDPSDGGAHVALQRRRRLAARQRDGNASTRITAYGIGYDLDLFSNFTYFLDDPVHGDQFEQADHRFVTGAKVSASPADALGRPRRCRTRSACSCATTTSPTVGLYHTQARARLRHATAGRPCSRRPRGVYAQNEIEWTPWLRTMAGAARRRVTASVSTRSIPRTAAPRAPASSARRAALIVRSVEAAPSSTSTPARGFHSNDARGTTITRDPRRQSGRSRDAARAREGRARSASAPWSCPHLQSTLSVWTLRLDSELVFSGDAGDTEPSRPSARLRRRVDQLLRPAKWLMFDGDVSWSRARFTELDPVGNVVPGSGRHGGVGRRHGRRLSPGVRQRAAALLRSAAADRGQLRAVEGDDAGQPAGRATSVATHLKLALDVFNLFNAADSDIDYYYASRLPGEPLGGVDDIHLHPALPRTARLGLVVGF